MGDKLPLIDCQTNTEETEEEPGLRMVLVGKTGAGKSATGNTILGSKVFKSAASSSTVTSTCQKEKGLFNGQHLSVVDTPGLFDTAKSEKEVKMEIVRCISFISPGPHVFLIVIQLNRFTAEEKKTIDVIKKIFGKEATDYTMALFTRGDDLEEDGVSIEEFIHDNPALSSFISQCGQRYHVFNNRNKDPSQVKELLEKINNMAERDKASYYTNKALIETEKAIQEKMREIMKHNPEITAEEARRQAEKSNRFIVACLSALGITGSAIGAGAGIGIEVAICATAGSVGGPVGAAVGAGVGLLAGGIVVAVKQKTCVIQ